MKQTPKFRTGERVRIDRSSSAYHRARGVEYEYGAFVEYDRDKHGEPVAIVRLDGDRNDTIWFVNEVEPA
jgi:hypothetical protein